MDKKPEIQLPHGPGFRLISTVEEIELHPPTVTATYTYTGEEEWKAADHFPGNPIMPGMMILESMAQCAVQLMANQPELKDKIPVFTGVSRADFGKRVKPGTTLLLIARVEFTDENRRGIAYCSALSGPSIAAKATIEFALLKKRG